MTKGYMNGWVHGAEHGLRGNPEIDWMDSYSPDYVAGYHEGYRIGKAFRNAQQG